MAADRYWPTRQQLIVVEAGEPDQVAQWMDAVREHQEACRDVIDLWDDGHRADFRMLEACGT